MILLFSLKGVKLNVVSLEHYSPYLIAIAKNDLSLLKFLVEKVEWTEEIKNDAFLFAVHCGYTEFLAFFMERNINLAVIDKNGNNCLHIAIEKKK